MNNLIACCGINCTECDARTATLNNDDNLRKEIAEKWKIQYNVPDISLEMINCTGCREEGAKIGHCAGCEIRNCVQSNDFETCADCSQMETCTIVRNIHKFVPKAKENLKLLRL